MTMTSSDSRTGGRIRILAVVGLVLAAFNLRPAVTSLGPVLEEVREGLGMSAAVAGLLTSVPAVCFALVGFAAPRLARRWGTGGAIALGTVALVVGLAVRPFAGGTASFIALTALALAGIALANVLLPVVVKQRFPDRVGMMTGLYSVALNLGASTAAAVTVPLTGAFGGDWRLGIGVWALVAAVALPAWALLARERGPSEAAAGRASTTGAGEPGTRLTRSPIAWALAVYFGLQSTAAYVIMGWLPQVFRDAGLPADTAGLLFSVTALLGVPLSFVLSATAGRLRSQSWVAVVIGLFGFAGYAGLWADPAAAPWLFAVLLGVANCSFPLVLTMIALRGRNAATVVRLSAFAQSTGYLIAIPGPILVGALYEHDGGWETPLALMALLMVPQMIAGFLAGRDRQIG
ncbi:MFS transporter [Amorphoplanes digitatis]|uniref:CP family cyanate transporter-like MFS transporter n=1 Tax=Actinoplanes digitatis TaxID=1868 RepID=A0A7W7MUL3_9ACTN|nr:MFS transporter [Actinoplanes digitatis]MBB4766880.1 CP family cyanate transporter-like MFS transporter [Actinoplanes digitatis]GID97736.1 MFS transporter [Actinoplanes digitatis]